MGIALDEDANRTRRADEHGGIVEVSQKRSPTKVLVVRTDEERMIAREAMRRAVGASGAIRSVRARPFRSASACATCISRAKTPMRRSARTTR